MWFALWIFPRITRARYTTPPPLEQQNKAVKRRSAVVGLFPCSTSMVRLVGAVLVEQNAAWLLQDRYMPKASLERLTGSVKELAEK